MPRPEKVVGKCSVLWTLIAVGGAGCAVAGALSLRAAINDPPNAEDPPQWVFVGLALGTVAFIAVLAIAAGARIWWALLALLASILSLVAFWTLAVLFAG